MKEIKLIVDGVTVWEKKEDGTLPPILPPLPPLPPPPPPPTPTGDRPTIPFPKFTYGPYPGEKSGLKGWLANACWMLGVPGGKEWMQYLADRFPLHEDDVWEVYKKTALDSGIKLPDPNAPPPIPKDMEPPTGKNFPWGHKSLSVSGGGEVEIVVPIRAGLVYLAVSLIGITNETDATYTWTFPDGKVFGGAVRNTSINGSLQVRTTKYGYPNGVDLEGKFYEYIPSGDHVFKVKGINNSSFILSSSII